MTILTPDDVEAWVQDAPYGSTVVYGATYGIPGVSFADGEYNPTWLRVRDAARAAYYAGKVQLFQRRIAGSLHMYQYLMTRTSLGTDRFISAVSSMTRPPDRRKVLKRAKVLDAMEGE